MPSTTTQRKQVLERARVLTGWAPAARRQARRGRKLIQRRRHEPRRRRLGCFQVERPGHEHGWVYPNAIIDCCTREIVGWELSLRCRAVEAIAVIERAVAEQGIGPGTPTLATDNGSAFVARATSLVISGLGVAHRRGGYRDPETRRSTSHRSATSSSAASGATSS